MSTRKPYPSDVSDDEWAFVAPYLTLMTEDAPQRAHPLREVFNGARWMVRTGAQWRMIPNDLPPWHTVYQQTQRWIRVGCFEAMVHDLRELLRVAQGRKPQPTAAILDGRTLQSSPESGERAGYDRAKRRQGTATTATYTYGNGLVRKDGETPLFDGLGSARSETNTSGTVTATLTLAAFGQTVASTGTSSSPYQYGATSGYRNDGDAGLTHVGARYYDAQVGRFITRDTDLSQQPYAYCDGDPVNAVDPSGHGPIGEKIARIARSVTVLGEEGIILGTKVAAVGVVIAVIPTPVTKAVGSVFAVAGVVVAVAGIAMMVDGVIAAEIGPRLPF